MACKISSESYNTLPALYANAGKWVAAEFHIKNDFYRGSGVSNKVTALGNTLTFDSGDWSDYGFVVGDVLTLTWTSYFGGLLNVGVKTVNRTITYINGNILYMNTPLPSPFTDLSFPQTGKTSGMAIKAIKQPQSIEFNFNLTKNGTTSQNSIIDGEINRFIHNQTTSLLTVNGTANMVQLGNKSGGIIKNVLIQRLADTTASVFTYSNYKITFKFLQWGLFEDANLHGGANYLAPIINAKTLPLAGNPNGTQQDTNGAKQANTGYFNENYNGGANPYIPISISWLDSLSNPISKLDYSAACSFTATITTPGQVNGSSIYRVGLGFTPETDSLYKNLLTSEANNLLINAPEVDFMHSAVPDATIYTGALNSSGAVFNFTALKFNHAAGVLTVTGIVFPNVNTPPFFDALADGERNIIIWVQISNYLLTGTVNNEVNVTIYDNDCFDAPTVGIQIPTIVDSKLFNIANLDITSVALPNTTTEDNLQYISNFRLSNSTVFDGVRCAISARNTVTNEVFELESNYFNFENVPYIGGVYQLVENINRPFNVSPGSNRRNITLDLNPAINIGGFYGVRLKYAFMNDWRYWLSDSSVDTEFFDLAQPNNGLNKNWQRFQTGDWKLNVDFYVRKEGVEDFNHLMYKDRVYENDPPVTATETITGSNLTVATNLLNNDLQSLAVVFAGVAWDVSWVEITIEDYESGNRWIRNSLEAIGNVPGCPIKPIAGQTTILVSALTTNLTARFLIDTNLVNAQNVSLTYRVYSTIKSKAEIVNYRKKKSFNVITIPVGFSEEDRGVDGCCCESLVLAGGSKSWQNDTTLVDVKKSLQGDSVAFIMSKCGSSDVIANLGTVGIFPNEPLAVGFIYDWSLILTAYGAGTYEITINYTISGVVGSILFGSYVLKPWSIFNARNTVRIKSEFRSYFMPTGIDYTGSNAVDTIRFKGTFGKREPNTEIHELIDVGRKSIKTKRENLNSYSIISYPLLECITRRLLDFHFLAQNNTFITDNNALNHSYQLNDFPCVISETPKLEYKGGSRLATINVTFTDRKLNQKSMYNV